MEITIYQNSKKKHEIFINKDNGFIQMIGLSIATRLLIEAALKLGVAGYVGFEGIKIINDLINGL